MALGRVVAPSESDNVGSFADFSPSDIGEIRALATKSGVLAISYIRFRIVGNPSLGMVVSYFETVIVQGKTVEEWLSP